MIKSGLPNDWKWTSLGKVCKQILGGGTPSTKKTSYWIGSIPWISSADIVGINEVVPRRRITYEAIENSTTNILPKGGIIVVTRVGLGKLAIAPYDISFSQDNQGLVLNEEIITQSYALLCLSRAVQKFKHESRGTTINGVTKKQLVELQIPLPPKPTQLAIVAKIKELFSELDKAIEQLKTAQQQLKTYRQAVLKAAFENDKFENLFVSEVAERIQIGPFGTQLHKEDYVEGGIPLINPTHIKDGVIVADSSFSILESKRDSLPNYILQEGDVIMGRRGEMARCGLVSKKEAGWFCGTGSLYFRPNKDKIDPTFLYYNLKSEKAKKYLENNAGGTTMANLNLKVVKDIPVALPSIEEQITIVQEIESRLSVADKMEESINQSLQHAEAMRQSILKRAFEGKLV